MKIGFIGTGVMGGAIVNLLLKANHEVTVFNRTKAKAETVMSNGAVWADSPKAVAEKSELVFTMVGDPNDVRQTWLSDNGLLAGLTAGQMAIDMTTSSPKLAKELTAIAAEKGVLAGEAPVSGADIGAINGTLSIMFGGSQELFDRLQPIFKVFGRQITRIGEAGAGQYMKMSNQLGTAAIVMGMSEMLVYAHAAKIDVTDIALPIWKNGGADSWAVDNYMPRVEAGDFKPGFYVKHMIKDLKLVLDSAHELGLDDLPNAKLALQLFEKLSEQGEDLAGIQALVKLWPAYFN